MTRVAVAFVFALLISATALAGNWNKSKDPGHQAQTGAVNIMVPNDVMNAFQNASPAVKAKYCSAFNEHPYREIARLSQNPPKRLFGYNSRMDNRKEVEGAIQSEEFVLKMSEAFTDSWVSGSDDKRQKVLRAKVRSVAFEVN